jgi:hypothetical protein
MLREALTEMGREDMIGSGKGALIPKEEPEEHRYARLKQKGLSDRGRPGGKGALDRATGKPGAKSGASASGAEARSGQGKPSNTRPPVKAFGKPGSKPSGKKPGKKLQKSIAEKAGVKQEGAKKTGKPSFKKRK